MPSPPAQSTLLAQGLQIPLRCLVRHRVQLFCRGVARHADNRQPRVPSKPAHRHRPRSETYDGNCGALIPVNGRFVCSCTGQWASRKGLPGRRVMAENSHQENMDGTATHCCACAGTGGGAMVRRSTVDRSPRLPEHEVALDGDDLPVSPRKVAVTKVVPSEGKASP